MAPVTAIAAVLLPDGSCLLRSILNILKKEGKQQIDIGKAILLAGLQILNHIAPCGGIFPPIAQQDGMIGLLANVDHRGRRIVMKHAQDDTG